MKSICRRDTMHGSHKLGSGGCPRESWTRYPLGNWTKRPTRLRCDTMAPAVCGRAHASSSAQVLGFSQTQSSGWTVADFVTCRTLKRRNALSEHQTLNAKTSKPITLRHDGDCGLRRHCVRSSGGVFRPRTTKTITGKSPLPETIENTGEFALL